MAKSSMRVAVIIGSTREGRFGDTVAPWCVGRIEPRNDMVVDLIDLADADLPTVLMEKPTSPVQGLRIAYRRCRRIRPGDAEYNHGYPASLKLALDSARQEWHAKPVDFVSYGGMAGGLRAVEHLCQICAELHMVSIRDTVSFHMAHRLFDETGALNDARGPNAAAKTHAEPTCLVRRSAARGPRSTCGAYAVTKKGR